MIKIALYSTSRIAKGGKMMDSVSEDLIDYQQPRGRLQILLHRRGWRWFAAGLMALALAAPFLIAHVATPESATLPPDTSNILFLSPGQQLSRGSNVPRSRPNGNEFTFSGSSAATLTNFVHFPELVSACTRGATSAITLSNVIVDAASFSESVEACAPTLEILSLENVSLQGNFSRVQLPKLRKFVYVQNPEDTRDSYKSPETLQQTLFFDLQSPWTVEQNLANLGVDITVAKGGTRLLDIQPTTRELYLNVKYCESILLHAQQISYDSLTLINCNVTDVGVAAIPPTLKYLNVRNALQRTPMLAAVVQKLQNLEELYVWLTFHCDWPGYELFLNLHDLPPTLRTLGINNVDTSVTPTGVAISSPAALQSLTVGDYTTPSTISQDYPRLLSNAARVNVINMSDPNPASSGYNLLHTAIKAQVQEIAAVHLVRNYSTAIANSPELLTVEGILDAANLPKEPISCFLLTLQSNGTYSGRLLSVEEQHEIRWRGLGFDRMDSWEDYRKWDAL